MSNMFLTFGIFLALSSYSCVNGLTCLQCTDIELPRHCKHVRDCPSGQVCFIHQTTDKYGDVSFDLGCTEQSVCMLSEQQEFGDTVYTSQCAVSTHCENVRLDSAPVVGRSVLEDTRSLTETTCHTCCHGDLCNANCSSSAQPRLKKDCKDLLSTNHVSGVYTIQIEGSQETIDVYCDMTTDGGGWTVFQRRVNGSVDFLQNFASYENGFGDVHGEFWMGLKYIHGLTKTAPTELRIDLVAADGSTAYEVFPNFLLSGSPYYALHVGKGNGTAGDDKGFSFTNGHVFSTLDHEKSVHCSSLYDAGWWYGTCCWAYLNGKYYTPGTLATGKSVGMFYHDFKGFEMLKETKMMFRRV
ncbi:microfibril-associated glycoprotein 4-like isoform X3 [Dreissena polymorpha]|uniref:microfibril-associated glycoprotein 4-like isoform X3 n=1 Tax=Dreissena polymorpha TaxID=45954 RepID=UPI002264EFA6|nr:microfibril-associated glycoprotein 4-like isoform X3 [Dreissena polymorpha]